MNDSDHELEPTEAQKTKSVGWSVWFWPMRDDKTIHPFASPMHLVSNCQDQFNSLGQQEASRRPVHMIPLRFSPQIKMLQLY